jgi:hypothetical protein
MRARLETQRHELAVFGPDIVNCGRIARARLLHESTMREDAHAAWKYAELSRQVYVEDTCGA